MKSRMAWEPQIEEYIAGDENADILCGGLTHQEIMNNRVALERKLQLRRPREQLISQGIMPAAITAPGLLSQRSKLERAKTGDLLQKKMRIRPNRAQLVQRHILNDAAPVVDPSLIAKQIKLKRKKLEDDLNDRLCTRPGPLELVKENILEFGTDIGQAVKEGDVTFTETGESVLLEPISPESVESSPVPSPETSVQSPPLTHAIIPELVCHNSVQVAVSQLQQLSEETDCQLFLKKEGRSRKKPPKPKFKKYKYHEYRPPNGEVQKSNLPMDSPYALMLQQQQLYLQLQVLYQNYQGQFVAMPSIPENAAKIGSSNNNNELDKPVRIEDMRVVDMRKELKMRGLPVSGSKTDLIERLKASIAVSCADICASSDGIISKAPLGSPSIIVTANSVMSNSQPVTVSSSGPMSGHAPLTRSNSLPVDNAQLQQLHMQLMANNQKLQQHTNLPPEIQQQLQQLQYLNLQLQLQRLHVQQAPTIQPKPLQGDQQQGGIPASIILGTQQVPSPTVSIKQEPNSPDTCSFAEQNGIHQYTNVSTASTGQATMVSQQVPQLSIPQQQMIPNHQYSSPNQQQKQKQLQQSKSLDDMSFSAFDQSQPSGQGLLLLQAEAHRLNSSRSQSEQDLSQMDTPEFSGHANMGWGQSHKALDRDNKGQQHAQESGTATANMFASISQPDLQVRTMDPVNLNQVSVKDHSIQRSYSERAPQDDDNALLQGIPTQKQRSLSEPPQPFGHKRSCSLPSTPYFLEHVPPPPSYEAHMAAQMHRKLSHDYTYPQQHQQQVTVKSEEMDIGMDSNQDREFTQELQRAMLKQEVGLDHDEILEILGAALCSPPSPKVQSTMGNQMAFGSTMQARLSPRGFSPNHFQHVVSPFPKSPSTGFLGVYSSPTHQFPGRLSKSCEDVTGINMNLKPGLQSCTDGSFPDFDTMIMSPGSPMKMDTDSDYQSLMMPPTTSITIPQGTRTDALSWLDLSNSPIITSTSPGITTDVTYVNRGTPPPSLYGTSPSLPSEQFPMSLFELDSSNTGHLPHDFPEAMDFCV